MKKLWESLFGIDLEGRGGADRAGQDLDWRLVWNGLPEGGDGILILGVLVIAIFAGVRWVYRRDGAELPAPTRRLLTALRIGAAVIALLMFLQPLLVVDRGERLPSNLVLLLDDSASMGVSDGLRDDPSRAATIAARLGLADTSELSRLERRELTRRLLDRGLRDDLAGSGARRVHEHQFSDRFFLEAPGDEDARGRSRENTAVGGALEQALAAYQGPPLAGVVLFSDGRSNAGVSPDRAARTYAKAGVPIHVVAVGDERELRNARVAAVEVNEIAFVRDPIQVVVSVEAQGLATESADLRLEKRRDGGDWEAVATQTLTFADEGRLSTATFSFAQDKPGEVELRATLDEISGEFGTEDNLGRARVRVVKKQMRALLVAGLAFPEVQFLTNALMRDPSIELSTWLMYAEPEYRQKGNIVIDRLPRTEEELDAYDCVLLYDPDLRQLPANFTEMLTGFVGRSGGGLVYIAGEAATRDVFDRKHPSSDALLDLLPVVREPGMFRTRVEMRLGSSTEWRVELTDAGLNSELFSFDDDAARNLRILRSLPGFYWHFPVTRPKPGAAVLARHGDARMSNQYGRHVVIATQLFGPGRSFFLAMDSSYRWRYLGENYFDGFWARLVNRAGFAKRLGGRQALDVSADRSDFAPGDLVEFRARFPEGERLGADLGSLAAEIEAGDESAEPLVFRPDPADPTLFLARHRLGRGGPHQVRVWPAEDPQEGARAASLEFEVRRPDRELMDASLDLGTLTRLAETTGGQVFFPDQVGRLAAAIETGFVDVIDQDRQELWDAPLLWGLLLLLIFVEWVLRKRNRMV